MSYQFYRKTTLGRCLTESLDELHQQKLIPTALVTEVLNQYDRAVSKVLAQNVRNKMNVHGKLNTYRFCDNVWTFILNNVEIRDTVDSSVNVPKLKIVACDAKASGSGNNQPL